MPLCLSRYLCRSYNNAVNSLAAKCDPAAFQAKFGAPIEDLRQLVDTKTVNIGKGRVEVIPRNTQKRVSREKRGTDRQIERERVSIHTLLITR